MLAGIQSFLTQKRPRVSLVPLIDVVFILLLFFLLSTQLNVLHDVEVQFPVANDEQEVPDVQLLKLENNDNQFSYLGRLYSANDLQTLRSMLVNDAGTVYVVESAADVQLQGLIQFVDQLHLAGITNISIFEDD